jgi:hypothetical protein
MWILDFIASFLIWACIAGGTVWLTMKVLRMDSKKQNPVDTLWKTPLLFLALALATWLTIVTLDALGLEAFLGSSTSSYEPRGHGPFEY